MPHKLGKNISKRTMEGDRGQQQERMEGEEAEVWLTVRETRGLFCSVGQGGVGWEVNWRGG